MKFVGAILLLVALVSGYAVYCATRDIAALREGIKGQGGFTSFLGETFGINALDRNRIVTYEQARKTWMIIGIGSGLLGLGFVSGGERSS